MVPERAAESTDPYLDAPARHFDRILGQVLGLYKEGRYQEAFDLLAASRPATPEQEAFVPYATAALQCRLGAADSALRGLEDALGAGLWWSPEMFEDDEDFEPLRARSQYRALMTAFEARLNEANKTSEPELLVFSAAQQARHLLVALHGRGRSAAVEAPYWRAAAEGEWIVAVAQSSQVFGARAYCWDDRVAAIKEIARGCDEATGGRKLPVQVIGGISQGGGLAIWAALTGAPVDWLGFVAVCPGFRFLPDIKPLIPDAARRGVRGWIIAGGSDPALARATEAYENLRGAGLAVEMNVIPGLGHDYPEDFADRLQSVLGSLVQGSVSDA